MLKTDTALVKSINKLSKLKIKTLTLSFFMAFSQMSIALPEDSQQPISISSDSAIKDNKKGFTVYEGNVDMKQGSLNIRADSVTIYIQESEVTKIIAKGNPARFKQQPELEKGDVLARAKTIEYSIDEKIIKLTESASLDQEGSTITGDVINYDIDAARVEADSDEGRVNVVIPAKQQ
jgi:lipopolysaccharide export system protein LptA